MNRLKSLVITLTFASASYAQGEYTYARFPAISPDGITVAFSYQGDIWTVPIAGGTPIRITIHEGYEGEPKWSPDGKQIAFTSNRFGNSDVFVIDAGGGRPNRITYHSASDVLSDWTNNGDLLFQTSRTFRQVEWDGEIHSVSHKGGTPVRILDAFGSEAVESPNGKFIAYTQGACRTAREQYQGSANKDIWIYNKVTQQHFQLTTFKGQDYFPCWGDDEQLFFLSAREGNYNVFSVGIDADGEKSGEFKQETHEKKDEVRNFDVNLNTETLVYEMDANLYKLNLKEGSVDRLALNISTDYRFDPFENKTYTSNVDEYSVSPNGELSAFVIHGDVFVTENDKKKSLTRNITKSHTREKHVAWLNDTTLLYSSDEGGVYNLYLARSSDINETGILKSLKHETIKLTSNKLDEHYPVVSPNGERIAFVRGGTYGQKEFIIADIDAKGKITGEKTLQKGWSRPSSVRWSPDNLWVAYTMEDLTFNTEVYIQQTDGKSKAVNVSMHPRGDYNPVWSPDGSKLGFVSDRNASNSDIWYVWLRKEDFQKKEQDWAEEEEKKEDENEEPLTIDTDRIHERLVQLTSLAGNEGNLAIKDDGKTFYFTSKAPGAKGSDLYEVKWDKSEMKAVTKGGKSPRAVVLSADGKYLFMNSKGKINRIKLAGNTTESIAFKAKMKIEFKKELDQVFEEGWRALRDGFYDPEFHGQDWNYLKKHFKPYCMAASTKTDFFHMYNLMLGQLNASHMGLRGKDRENTQKETTGLLGVEVTPTKNGVKVVRVVAGSPADRASSKIEIGDIILMINNEDISSTTSFWALLNNTAGEKQVLTIRDKNGKTREVAIRPTSSLRDELYDEWVNERRALVDKYSKGRLGYLHIRGMNMPSFERFERELTAAGHGKEGIVIDVRYNGGGWTTDYLMAVLNVKQHAYTVPRGATESLKNHKEYREYYPFSERLPFFAWNKPSIALCNQNSYSNAEIFSHAYKNLGIGTLVGRPTFGAVISTGGMGLLDGSFIRMPFRAWYVKVDDKNMETDPAVPHIDLENSPNAKAKGMDEQLKRSVDELLKQLDSK